MKKRRPPPITRSIRPIPIPMATSVDPVAPIVGVGEAVRVVSVFVVVVDVEVLFDDPLSVDVDDDDTVIVCVQPPVLTWLVLSVKTADAWYVPGLL